MAKDKDKDKLEKKVAKLNLKSLKRHIFICNDTDKCNCASEAQMKASWKHLKKRLKELGGKESRVLCSRTRCLGICSQGPVAVVYPEGVWYRHCDEKALDTIIERHLLDGEIVEDYCFARTKTES